MDRGGATKRSDSTPTAGGGCRRILERGDLLAKLEPVVVLDPDHSAPLIIEAPARDAAIAFSRRSSTLPRPDALEKARNRARCLARFAHHELMAVELFAWALRRWPALPVAMAHDFLRALGDEQLHCRLYLARLADHDATLSDFPCSDYIWRHCASAPEPRAFLCAMGLTLEQANLDFSLRYAAAFRAAGDEASAAVLERVHEDEVRHVAVAATWLRFLDPEACDDVSRYKAAVPFPLSAARAKGRPFFVEPRRRAGLSEGFIEYVRQARSSQELAGKVS